MTVRAFDRFMVAVEIASNPKVARFTDGEFRCLVSGVWALAAKANPRGLLTVGGHPATSRDVAHQARCTVAVAKKTLDKMSHLRMIDYDEKHGCYAVHDWNELNPSPKGDRTNTERQRRFREKRNGSVTPDVTPSVTPDVTASNAGEVEGEVEVKPASQVNTNAELRSAVVECFAYWQHRCGHPQAQLTADRKGKLETRLRERAKLSGGVPQAIADVRLAIDGAAIAPFIDDKGKRFDDIELICRKGSKLEDFMGRAAGPADGNVVPMRSAAVNWMNRYELGYEGDSA